MSMRLSLLTTGYVINRFMYIYVWINLSIYADMYIDIHIFMCVYDSFVNHFYVYICVRVYLRVRLHVYVCVQIMVYVCKVEKIVSKHLSRMRPNLMGRSTPNNNSVAPTLGLGEFEYTS